MRINFIKVFFVAGLYLLNLNVYGEEQESPVKSPNGQCQVTDYIEWDNQLKKLVTLFSDQNSNLQTLSLKVGDTLSETDIDNINTLKNNMAILFTNIKATSDAIDNCNEKAGS